MLEPRNNDELPAIPGKRYFTIGEVSELCGVKPHVLRYWEQEFPQLKPVKRRGNRRYYQRQDVHRHPPDPQPAVRAGLHDRRRAQAARGRGSPRRTSARASRSSRQMRVELEELLEDPAPLERGMPVRSTSAIASTIRYNPRLGRGVAQSGSALAWGARGRRFESSRSDQFPDLPEHSWLPRVTPWVRHERTGNTVDPDHRADGGLRRRHEGRTRAGGGQARRRVARRRSRHRPAGALPRRAAVEARSRAGRGPLQSPERGNSPTKWRSASASPTVRADQPRSEFLARLAAALGLATAATAEVQKGADELSGAAVAATAAGRYRLLARCSARPACPTPRWTRRS